MFRKRFDFVDDSNYSADCSPFKKVRLELNSIFNRIHWSSGYSKRYWIIQKALVGIMHACSLGLFLVTTALQPLAGGCTKMSWDTEQVWLKFSKILLNFSVILLLVLNTMQVDCQEPCLSNVSGPFRKWHYKDQLLTYNLSLKRCAYLTITMSWKCLQERQLDPWGSVFSFDPTIGEYDKT